MSVMGGVTIAPIAAGAAMASAALTFTRGDWNRAQTVTVTGGPPDRDLADRGATVSHTAGGVGSGYGPNVAIADVSHYVRPGSGLDHDAHERGNSVYLPDRVVPMLPEALSAAFGRAPPR